MDHVAVTLIRNPFDPHNSRDLYRLAWRPGLTVRDAVADLEFKPKDEFELITALNGHVCELSHRLERGDHLSFCQRIADPGDDKNIFGTIAMLAVVAASVFVPGWLGLTSTLGKALVGAAVMTAGGYLVNSIFPTPAIDGESDYSKSQTYSWDPTGNEFKEGLPVPVLYGVHKITPPLISRYVETVEDKQYLHLLYAVAEGPVDSIGDVEINGNPVANYDEVTVETRLGTNDQTVIADFQRTYADTAVGTEVTYGSPVTARTTSSNADRIGIGILWPYGLAYINDSGEPEGAGVYFKVEYRKVGDVSWTTVADGSYGDASTSAVRFFTFFDTPSAGEYDVMVTLTAEPETGSRYLNRTYFEYLQESISDTFTYPNTALLAIRALATDQLSGSQPTVTCVVNRYTVKVWNGATEVDYLANNPAWACYDMLYNRRYGGQVAASPDRINFNSFFAWATFCANNDLTCNLYVDQQTSLQDALRTLATVGRGVVIQRGTSFDCLIDQVSVPVQMFTIGNILAETFQESFLSVTDRANAIDLTFYDADIDYQARTIQIRNDDFDTSDDELVSQGVTLYGCTNYDQAYAHGKYLLWCNNYLTTSCSFEVDVDAIACQVGDVIYVQHNVPVWGCGGRIVSATSAGVVLDQAVTLETGTTYQVMVRHQATDAIETRTVAAVEEETTTANLTLTTAWTNIPAADAVYSFGPSTLVAKRFRITEITRAQDQRRKITALEYYDEIYADAGTPPPLSNETLLTFTSSLRAVEQWRFNADGTGRPVASLTWTGNTVQWTVFYRASGASVYKKAGVTQQPWFEIDGLQHGVTWEFAVSHTDNPGDGETASLTITGVPTAGPNAITGLNIAISGRLLVLTWGAGGVGETYNLYLNDVLLVSGYGGNRYVYAGTLTAGTYNFDVYAVDSYGQEAAVADSASIVIVVPSTPSVSSALAGEVLTLSWAACGTSLPIDYYLVNDGVNNIRVGGTSYSVRVSWTGAKVFTVKAIDVAGNESGTDSETVTYSVVPAATGLTATGQPYAVLLTMTLPALDTLDYIEVWESETNQRANAVLIGRPTSASFTRSGLPLIATRYYWVRMVDIFGTKGAFYPSSATAGVEGATSTDPTDILSVLTGQITESQLYVTLSARIDQIDTSAFYIENGYIEADYFAGMNGAFSGLSEIQDEQYLDMLDIQANANAQLSRIQGLEAEVAGLVTSPWDDEAAYTVDRYVTYGGEVYRCIQAYTPTPTHYPDESGSAYWELADSIVTLVSSIETRVDDLEAEITTKATSVEFNALENRVDATETTIIQNTADILLKADQTTVDAISGLLAPEFDADNEYIVGAFVLYEGHVYRCILAIDFTPAPAPGETSPDIYWVQDDAFFSNLTSQIDVTADAIEIISTALIGTVFIASGYVDDYFVEDIEDLYNLDCRISEAKIIAKGMDGKITLMAGEVDGIDSRLTQAEIDIDGANAAIALRATTTELNALDARVSQAEITIDAQAGITLSHTTAIAGIEGDLEDENGYSRLAKVENKLLAYDTQNAEDYSAATTYNPGKIVRYSSAYYLCLKTALNKIPNSETAYWQAITAGLAAQWTVKLDVNGNVAGMGLMLDETGTSEFDIVASKFRVINPSSPGQTPKVPFTVGSIGGASVVGISGDLIIDGTLLARTLAASTITADKIAANTITGNKIAAGTITATNIAASTITADRLSVSTLSAITANIGQVTAGIVANAGLTNYMNLNATGTQPFIKVGNEVVINADGSGTFARNLITNPAPIYTGYINGTMQFPYIAEYNSYGNFWKYRFLPISGSFKTTLVSGNYNRYYARGKVVGSSSPGLDGNWYVGCSLGGADDGMISIFVNVYRPEGATLLTDIATSIYLEIFEV